ncbi:MAG: potassium/proton antiporter [Gemmatimonadales bacterium]
MIPNEPFTTAVALAVFGALMVVSVLFSRAAERTGIPVMLIFLAIGMLAGSEGLGGIPFEDYRFAFRLGTTALALILFDGGLNTSVASVRRVLRPAATLATVGVVGTAALVAVVARGLGFSWTEGLLLGAVVSSTDAAAVFAVLRGSGVSLKRRVGVTLELESGLNDPVAVMLTIALTAQLAGGDAVGWRLLWQIPLQLAVGAALGVALGYGGRALLQRARLPVGGLYPVLTVALACLAFGLPTLVFGSGFLAVYVAAVVLGNSPIPYRTGLLRVHDAIAWFSQVAMFVMLGLLAFPSRLAQVAVPGLAIGLFLAAVARPVVVLACLAPFRYPLREVLYVGWVGLRGAVPITLATFPVLAGVAGGSRIFDVVFFVVVISALVSGGSVGWITRRLGLQAPSPPRPQAVLELHSSTPLGAEVLSFYVEPAAAVAGSRISELPFPEGAAVTLIVRGDELLAPKGGTVLQAGDHVFVFCRPEDRPFVQLLFGRLEHDDDDADSEAP